MLSRELEVKPLNTQILPSGKVFVALGVKMEYQSPLWIISASDTEVLYAECYQGAPVARVYKKDDEWFLSTAYLNHWIPMPTLSKYEGFLFLLSLRKKQCL
jgi:hypothetical protein